MLPFVPIILGAAWAAYSLPRPRRSENPTRVTAEARSAAEEAQGKAEQVAKEARGLAEQIRQRAAQDRKRARARQEEAGGAAEWAAEEVERMLAQVKEVTNAMKRAQELGEAAAKTAKEEAARFEGEAKEERERSQRIREEAAKAVVAAKEEAMRALAVAEERRRDAEIGRTRAELMARSAAEETLRAIKAKDEAERRWKAGTRPVVTPSQKELAVAKQRIQHIEGSFHFAVVGISGSGKSSLVNAFRGLHNLDAGAAAVGVTETTLQMARYADGNPESPYVWYDIPGAGTLKCADWQYFNNQGLYVFDSIIVLLDNRFTMTDIAILVNARRFEIPTYIVRSKADQHIRNVMKDMGYHGEGDDEDTERRNQLCEAARKQYVEKTRRSIQASLEDANLPGQRVYIVSNTTLLSIVLNKTPKKTIDEVDLLNDLISEACARRSTKCETK